MKIQTELGEVDLSDQDVQTLRPRNVVGGAREEVERIIRCAMQIEMNIDESKRTATRIAVSKVAAESINAVIRDRVWR